MHKVYLSDSVNPYFNLAFEEYLVQHHNSMDQVLFLWQNNNTVVIGRNQNPWKECNLEELNCQSGKLVRRLSGGGAVYHDLGNLNFTFVSAYSEGKIKENMNLIIEALVHNGITAVFSGKNDITAEGFKVSGNAYFVEEDILCHHGTLLFDTDLEKLSRILTPSQRKLESKGIDSIRARVKNIKELNGKTSIQSLKNDLVTMFSPEGGVPSTFCIDEEAIDDADICMDGVRNLMKKYESWEWNYGASPEFNLQISERYPWGEIDLYILVQDGIIVDLKVDTDALDFDLPQKIKEKICLKKFDYDEVISEIDQFSANIWR